MNGPSFDRQPPRTAARDLPRLEAELAAVRAELKAALAERDAARLALTAASDREAEALRAVAQARWRVSRLQDRVWLARSEAA